MRSARNKKRRQGRHDVLDQAKRRFAPQTDRDEIVKCRRKYGAETIELGADQRLARMLLSCRPVMLRAARRQTRVDPCL